MLLGSFVRRLLQSIRGAGRVERRQINLPGFSTQVTSLFENSAVFLPSFEERLKTFKQFTHRRRLTTACTAGMRDEAQRPTLQPRPRNIQPSQYMADSVPRNNAEISNRMLLRSTLREASNLLPARRSGEFRLTFTPNLVPNIVALIASTGLC
ncbi:hypothetical protein CBL_01928 [Carabus blaptoides fortunei]